MSTPEPAIAEHADRAPRHDEPTPRPPVPRWAIHRRMYEWVLSFAHHRHATPALFVLSFAESSFFPVPPDVLQVALTLERRRRAWFYAMVSTLASVVGGVLGYLIGWGFWEATQAFFFEWIPGFTPEVFEQVKVWYADYDALIIFAAAFTPIPYKVFTVTAGVFGIFLPVFVVASTIGRAARFFLIAALLYYFGAPVRTFIDKYFNMLCLVLTLLLVAGFVILRMM